MQQSSDSNLDETRSVAKTNMDNVDNVSNGGTSGTKPMEWSPENEMIMVGWCDNAQCYKWMNLRSHEKYSSRNAWYTIPSIVLSTISGTASFAQASLPLQYQSFAPMVIGSINILVGILTTVQQYLKISELNEAHRVSAISWDKFARNIKIELAKKPDERMDAEHFLKLNRQEFDRLMETSPTIHADVIKEFTTLFQGKDGTDERKHFDQLNKPDICNVIVSANETRHHWYKDLALKSSDSFDVMESNRAKDEIIESQHKVLREKEVEMKRTTSEIAENAKKQLQQIEAANKRAKTLAEASAKQTDKISAYIKAFLEQKGRKPMKDEVYEAMKEAVDMDILSKFLATYIYENDANV